MAKQYVQIGDGHGVVYVLQAVSGGPVKIGWAGSWDRARKRCLECQTGNPLQLVIVHAFEGTWSEEQRLHEKFAEYRLMGEWFSNAEEALKEIERMKLERTEDNSAGAARRRRGSSAAGFRG